MIEADASFLPAAFAEAMARLGPFEPNPKLMAAVSGGADSMALAVLAQGWAQQRQGTLQALVVDHGLRPESPEEARITIARLNRLGIVATLLRLTALGQGSALAERARTMRYQALSAACRSAGSVHLLLGHHAADQIETMMMRTLGRSLTHGLAAMPALLETVGLRLLRPLLTVRPDVLRTLLKMRGIEWVEDPSNRDLKALRPRLRHRLSANLPDEAMTDLTAAADRAGGLRAREESEAAAELARRAVVRPEGFALLSPGRIGVQGLATLLRTIGGGHYSPSLEQIADLAAEPRPATVAGVRLLSVGRSRDILLLVREERAIADPIGACSDAVWDRRFRLISDRVPAAGTFIGKLGPDAARLRSRSALPSAVLRTLPAIRCGERLAAVPHLGYVADTIAAGMDLLFTPPLPMCGSCFFPA